MAFPTATNDQITDSVSQANVQVLGDSPAMAMGTAYISSANALSILFHNAVHEQQQGAVTAQSATVAAVARLLGEAGPRGLA